MNIDDTTVQIILVNNNPISLDDSTSTPANTPVILNILSNDIDLDGHPLTITSINGVVIVSGTTQIIPVPNGSLTVSITGLITFTPDPLYTGPLGFPYAISDGN